LTEVLYLREGELGKCDAADLVSLFGSPLRAAQPDYRALSVRPNNGSQAADQQTASALQVDETDPAALCGPASKTIAVLGRRVFAAGPVPESVDCVHRTTAEYLGAAWLAHAVRAGLPIGRVIALTGVDGHPAPELRGLPFAVAQWRQISGEMRQPGLDPGVDPRFHLLAQRSIGREGTK
jgi:hypothetical protein